MFHHVASGVFAVMLTVVSMTSGVFLGMFHVMAVVRAMRGFAMRNDRSVFHRYFPFVLPFWAIPSARRDAELTDPPFL